MALITIAITSLSLDLGYQDHQVDSPRPAVTPVSAIPEAPDSDTNAQEWTYTNERQFFGAVRENTILPTTSSWAAAVSDRAKKIMCLLTLDRKTDFSAYRFDNVRNDEIRSGSGPNIEFKTASVDTRSTSASTFFQNLKMPMRFLILATLLEIFIIR